MDLTTDGIDFLFTPAGTKATGSTIEEAAVEKLVQSAVAGNDDAFRRIVESYREQIFHFSYQWLRDTEDAREVSQDTFVRAYQALPAYRNQGKFSVWLYRIALNLCRDRFKSKSSRQQRNTHSFEELPDASECSRLQPDESALLAEDLKKLWKGIELLPDKLRTVTILCCLEGLSQEVCAQILHTSPRAVEGRLYRARKKLQIWWVAEEN